MVEPYLFGVVGTIFYLGIDLVIVLYYSGKYDDKEWKKVKTCGIFTGWLKKVMKQNSEGFRRKDA